MQAGSILLCIYWDLRKNMSRKLIINADDFGCNSNINAAIVSCFEKDIINSTTIMANMPGFDEAIDLALKKGFTDKIGLHINLTEGKSLTDLSGTGLTNADGEFIQEAVVRRRISLPVDIKRKIKAEMEAQYNKLIATGIRPTHLDSHLHIHILPHLVFLFIEFAKEKQQKMRIVTVGMRKNIFIVMYNIFLNKIYKKQRVNFSDIFGNVGFFSSYMENNTNFERVFEIMVHPAYHGDNLVEIFANVNLEERINQMKAMYHQKCIEFNQMSF